MCLVLVSFFLVSMWFVLRVLIVLWIEIFYELMLWFFNLIFVVCVDNVVWLLVLGFLVLGFLVLGFIVLFWWLRELDVIFLVLIRDFSFWRSDFEWSWIFLSDLLVFKWFVLRSELGFGIWVNELDDGWLSGFLRLMSCFNNCWMVCRLLFVEWRLVVRCFVFIELWLGDFCELIVLILIEVMFWWFLMWFFDWDVWVCWWFVLLIGVFGEFLLDVFFCVDFW